jgi:hypothetical protein
MISLLEAVRMKGEPARRDSMVLPTARYAGLIRRQGNFNQHRCEHFCRPAESINLKEAIFSMAQEISKNPFIEVNCWRNISDYVWYGPRGEERVERFSDNDQVNRLAPR